MPNLTDWSKAGLDEIEKRVNSSEFLRWQQADRDALVGELERRYAELSGGRTVGQIAGDALKRGVGQTIDGAAESLLVLPKLVSEEDKELAVQGFREKKSERDMAAPRAVGSLFGAEGALSSPSRLGVYALESVLENAPNTAISLALGGGAGTLAKVLGQVPKAVRGASVLAGLGGNLMVNTGENVGSLYEATGKVKPLGALAAGAGYTLLDNLGGIEGQMLRRVGQDISGDAAKALVHKTFANAVKAFGKSVGGEALTEPAQSQIVGRLVETYYTKKLMRPNESAASVLEDTLNEAAGAAFGAGPFAAFDSATRLDRRSGGRPDGEGRKPEDGGPGVEGGTLVADTSATKDRIAADVGAEFQKALARYPQEALAALINADGDKNAALAALNETLAKGGAAQAGEVAAEMADGRERARAGREKSATARQILEAKRRDKAEMTALERLIAGIPVPQVGAEERGEEGIEGGGLKAAGVAAAAEDDAGKRRAALYEALGVKPEEKPSAPAPAASASSGPVLVPVRTVYGDRHYVDQAQLADASRRHLLIYDKNGRRGDARSNTDYGTIVRGNIIGQAAPEDYGPHTAEDIRTYQALEAGGFGVPDAQPDDKSPERKASVAAWGRGLRPYRLDADGRVVPGWSRAANGTTMSVPEFGVVWARPNKENRAHLAEKLLPKKDADSPAQRAADAVEAVNKAASAFDGPSVFPKVPEVADNPAANENGVYSGDGAETLSFGKAGKGARVGLLKTPNGWVNATEWSTATQGSRSPLRTDGPYYESREEALSEALSRISVETDRGGRERGATDAKTLGDIAAWARAELDKIGEPTETGPGGSVKADAASPARIAPAAKFETGKTVLHDRHGAGEVKGSRVYVKTGERKYTVKFRTGVEIVPESELRATDAGNVEDGRLRDMPQSEQAQEDKAVKPAATAEEAMAALQKKLDERLAALTKHVMTHMNAGFDTEAVRLGAEVAAVYVEMGVVKFREFARRMRADAPEVFARIKGLLHAIWSATGDATGAELEDLTRAEARAVVADVETEAGGGAAEDAPAAETNGRELDERRLGIAYAEKGVKAMEARLARERSKAGKAVLQGRIDKSRADIDRARAELAALESADGAGTKGGGRASVRVEKEPDGDVTVSVPKADVPGLGAKEQKRYLLAELAKAVEAVPVYAGKQADAVEEFEKKLRAFDARPNSKTVAAVDAKDAKDLEDAGIGKVTIEVPGDGVFTIWNTRYTLKRFRDKADRMFPGSDYKRAPFPSVTVPRQTSFGQLGARGDDVTGMTPELSKAMEVFSVAPDDSRAELRRPAWNAEAGEAVASNGHALAVVLGTPGGGGERLNVFDQYPKIIPGYRAGALPEDGGGRGFTARVDTGRLSRKLRQALMASDTTKLVHLMADASGAVEVFLLDNEDNSYSSLDGRKGFELGVFDPELVLKVLAFLRGRGNDSVRMTLRDGRTPTVFTGEREYVIVSAMRDTGAAPEELDAEKGAAFSEWSKEVSAPDYAELIVRRRDEANRIANEEAEKSRAEKAEQAARADAEKARADARMAEMKRTAPERALKAMKAHALYSGVRSALEAAGASIPENGDVLNVGVTGMRGAPELRKMQDELGRGIGLASRKARGSHGFSRRGGKVDTREFDLNDFWYHEDYFEEAVQAELAQPEEAEAEASVAAETVGEDDSAEREAGRVVEDRSASPAKLEDFGEKIGGARKDVAERGFSMSGKKADAEDDGSPAWRKQFIAAESVTTPGQWGVIDKKDRFGGSRQTFSSQSEAEAAIPLFAVAQKHSVYQNKDGKWEIYKRVGDRKRLKVVGREFDSREDAVRHMAAHAEELLNLKTSFGEEILPVPELARREGAPRRTSDATPEMFMETFAPRGIEFGNWNNQDERRAVMNHAYDGLTDLAETLGLPPKALMLNGDLAIAFGARGNGLSGAKAHYETDYGVINLTKMSGAGSLAHEWMHALDHYLARIDTKATSEKKPNTRGDMVYPNKSYKYGFQSHGYSYTSKMREELKKAYNGLVESLFHKAQKYVDDTQVADKFLSKAKEHLRDRLNEVRSDLERDNTSYHKSKGGYSSKSIKFFQPASAEQLAEFDRLADSLVEGGNLETVFRYNTEDRPSDKPKGMSRSAFGRAMAGRHTNDTLESISAIVKAARGRSGFMGDQNGPLDRVRAAMTTYSARLKMLNSAKAGEEKERQAPTDYAIEARKMDQARTGDYWSEPHEMVARAFASYVEDKIAANGGASEFLVYRAHGGILLPMIDGFVARPYPEGKERKAINGMFDAFVREIRTRETERGVEMYSVSRNVPQDAAGKAVVADHVLSDLKEYEPVEMSRAAWDEMFPGNSANTPVGVVRFGENQYEKFSTRGDRREFLGMLKPTLEDPAAVVRERDGKLVFLRGFDGAEGGRYFMAAAVEFDGDKVVVSGHRLRDGQVASKIEKGELVFTTALFTPSQGVKPNTNPPAPNSVSRGAGEVKPSGSRADIQSVAEAMGVAVEWGRPEEMRGIDGMVRDGKAVLNPDADRGALLRFTFGHEAAHLMEGGENYVAFLLRLERLVGRGAVDTYLADLNKRRAGIGLGKLTKRQALREIAADLVGARMADARFWNKVKTLDAPLWKKIVAWVKGWITEITNENGSKIIDVKQLFDSPAAMAEAMRLAEEAVTAGVVDGGPRAEDGEQRSESVRRGMTRETADAVVKDIAEAHGWNSISRGNLARVADRFNVSASQVAKLWNYVMADGAEWADRRADRIIGGTVDKEIGVDGESLSVSRAGAENDVERDPGGVFALLRSVLSGRGGEVWKAFGSSLPGLKSSDLSKLSVWFSKVDHYAEKIPAFLRIHKRALRGSSDRHELAVKMFGGTGAGSDHETVKAFFFGGSARNELFGKYAEEARDLQEYIVETDRDRDGPVLKRSKGPGGDEVYGVLVPVEDDEGGEFVRKELAAGLGEQAALDAAHEWEGERLSGMGFSPAAVNALKAFRRITDRVWTEWMRSVRDYEAAAKLEGIELSQQEKDLFGELRDIGDLRGTFFPRNRTGRYALRWNMNGVWHMERFGTAAERMVRETAVRSAGGAIPQGDKGRFVVDTPSEEAHGALDVASLNEYVLAGIEGMRKDDSGTDWTRLGVAGRFEPYERGDGVKERHFVIDADKAKGGVFREVFLRHGGRWYGPKDPRWHFNGMDDKGVRDLFVDSMSQYYGRVAPVELLGKALVQQLGTLLQGRGASAHKISRTDAVGDDVPRGYEEDALKALTSYVMGTAGSRTKTEMARDFIKFLAGTDLSFEDFKRSRPGLGAEVLATAYLDEVGRRRISAAQQPVAWGDAKSYIDDILRNQSEFERVCGFLSGMAAIWRLSASAGAAVNVTSLVTHLPAAAHMEEGVAFGDTLGGLPAAISAYTKWKMAVDLRKGRPDGLDGDAVWALDRIRELGWGDAVETAEYAGVLASAFGKAYEKTGRMALLAFSQSEKMIRAASILSVYKALRKSEPVADRDALLERAKNVSDKANGGYGRENRPSAARGGGAGALARVAYVFNTFGHNTLLLMHRAGVKKKDYRALSWLLLSPAMFGLRASGFSIVATAAYHAVAALARAFGARLPEDPEEAFYAWMRETFGAYAEGLSRAGILYPLNMDITGSLRVLNMEDVDRLLQKRWWEMGGAPVGMVADWVSAVRLAAGGDWWQAAETASPRAVQSKLRMLRERDDGVSTRAGSPVYFGEERLKASASDSLVRFFGGNPYGISSVRNRQWSERRTGNDAEARRDAVYEAFRRMGRAKDGEYGREDVEAAMAELAAYNEWAADNAGNPYVRPISAKGLKSVIENAVEAPDAERGRAAAIGRDFSFGRNSGDAAAAESMLSVLRERNGRAAFRSAKGALRRRSMGRWRSRRTRRNARRRPGGGRYAPQPLVRRVSLV